MVMGWSMGAYAALQFARLHPERVGALVLVGIGSGSPAGDEELWRMQMRDLSAAWLADLEGHSPEGMARTCRNYQGRRPSLQVLEEEFAGLQVPTLVVCGEEDAPCLETSRWLERVLPNAELWLEPGGGHCPNLETPDKFNTRIGRFLADVREAPHDREQA